MRDLLPELEAWWRDGTAVGLATVVSTWRSAPRSPGASMAVAPDGSVAGSVSGGCVEGAVYDLAVAARDTGTAALERYGVQDEDAFAVGLTCGGVIELFIERFDSATFPAFGRVAADIRAGRPVAVATVVAGPLGRRVVMIDGRAEGSTGSPGLDHAVTVDMRSMLERGQTGVRRYGPNGERRHDDVAVFVAAYTPRPRMIVFGATDFAAAMARMGSFLNYRVTVCDARATFATSRRFPDADDVVVDWPHRYLAKAIEAGEVDERTVICVLTHDPKFDVPVLELALRVPLAYVGAMGSRRTNDDRAARLRACGVAESELTRLHAPIGLDVGAATPEETAVSIAGEILAVRTGSTGGQLRGRSGPIHRDGRHAVGR